MGQLQRLSHHPLRCPFCSNEETQVKDSRPTEDGTAIRRRR
jgi:transcriptional repressor NrdR